VQSPYRLNMYYLTIFLLADLLYAHSWLECTKYTGNLEDFEKDKCEGLPRPLPGNRNVGGTFGADIGMDFRPQAGGARCQGSPTAPSTMVSYEAGKTYTLAWAPKNHVAAECTNAFIPDNFLRVYMHPYNGNTDPTQEQFKANQVKASFSDDPHVRGQIDYKGFQNCPKFCENTDKALCTGTITIPADATLGQYTFQWYWAFNSETDLYATCWEAEVVANTGGGATDGGAVPAPTVGPEVTTTTTTTFAPCNNCCDPTEIVAPGTGDTMVVSPIEEGKYEWFDCPEGFGGQIKMFCMPNDSTKTPRLFDGYCEPLTVTDNDEENQDGTVAGLAVALTLVTLAFCLYVAVTQGWITQDTFATKGKDGGESLAPPARDYEAPISPRQAPGHVRARVKSVFTESKTELPVLPETPEWHYVNEEDKTIGPVTTQAVVQWARRIGVEVALQTYVWNGTTVTDWTLLSEVEKLRDHVKSANVTLSE